MNLFNATFANLATQKRSIGSGNLLPLTSFFKGSDGKIKHLPPHTSLKISAFWCGVNTIANSIAILPKSIYRRVDNKIEAQTTHPVTKLIYRTPNNCSTAFKFWFSYVVCILIKGNGYARILRGAKGEPTGLELLHPEDVTVKESNGRLYYQVRGVKGVLQDYQMFHVPGFSFDGKLGIGVIHYAAQNMAMTLGADDFASKAYEDRGLSYGVVETDLKVTDIGKSNIRTLVKRDLQDIAAHKIAVLDEGMKYKNIALTPNEAMFIEAKAQGVEDIARWLNIPLHKLHTKGEGGYNFLVQMSIEYLTSSVQPIAQPIREEIERKLLFSDEYDNGYYAHFNYKKLLEVDPKSRGEYYKNLVTIKAMNPNEVRQLEDMNPYDGGDEFLQLANMMTESQVEKTVTNEE